MSMSKLCKLLNRLQWMYRGRINCLGYRRKIVFWLIFISYCATIYFRDHVFDTPERKRLAGRQKCSHVSMELNAIMKGQLGVRWEKARNNYAKMLPTMRMGISEQIWTNLGPILQFCTHLLIYLYVCILLPTSFLQHETLLLSFKYVLICIQWYQNCCCCVLLHNFVHISWSVCMCVFLCIQACVKETIFK